MDLLEIRKPSNIQGKRDIFAKAVLDRKIIEDNGHQLYYPKTE